jgi:hypothetical protein
MKAVKIYRPIGNIDIGFWNTFSKLKVEEFKLDDSDRPLHARCSLSNRPESVSILILDIHSFQKHETIASGPFEVQLTGTLHCCNTIEGYLE